MRARAPGEGDPPRSSPGGSSFAFFSTDVRGPTPATPRTRAVPPAPPSLTRLSLPLVAGLLNGERRESKFSPRAVVFSSWFIALAVFALVFVAGTVIGAAFNGDGAVAEPTDGALSAHDRTTNALTHGADRHHHRKPAHDRRSAAEKKAQTAAELEEWYNSMGKSAGLGKKRAPQIGDRPLPESKSERAVPARVTRDAALDKWYTEVSATAVAKRERDAKRSALDSIASLSKWYGEQPNTPSRRDVVDKLKDKTRAAASLGHSYTPVVHAHSLRQDPKAPAALELGVQAYLRAFEGVSTRDLLSKAQDSLRNVDRFVTVASRLNILVEADDMDALPRPANVVDKTQEVVDQIFATATKGHPWSESGGGFHLRKSRKLLGGGIASKSARDFAAEYGEKLGVSGEEAVALLPSLGEHAKGILEMIDAKGAEATEEEHLLSAMMRLTAAAARASPGPVGKGANDVFEPTWGALMHILPDASIETIRGFIDADVA